MNKKQKILLIMLFIILIITLSIFTQRKSIISIMQNKKAESLQDIDFEVYYNKNNLLKILVTAIDTENGIKTLTYEKEDGNKVEIKGNGKNRVALDYEVEKDGEYEFKFINGAGEEISKVLKVNDKYRRNYFNLNRINVSKFETNGYLDGCIPGNAIDGSTKGNSWYGGTKLLIEYSTLSTITHMGIYTNNGWKFNYATIYYSEDDSLTLDSDLNDYKYIMVNTENIQRLKEKINAKRIILIKEETNSVYEFECFGNANIDTEGEVYIDQVLQYPILTKDGIKNIKRINFLDENDYTYETDFNKQCTAYDALDFAAYDGNYNTYYDGISGKNKFYFGNDIDIYQMCFKIDSYYNGHLFVPVTGMGSISAPREGEFIGDGIFHTTYYGKGSNAWKGTFSEICGKVYEIYYDKSLE